MSMGQIPPGAPARHNEYFIDRDGIDREVITADICRYLGHDALVRTGVYEDPVTKQNRPGYYITAYRNLTSAMIEDLKNDSARWEQERANHAARNTRVVASPVDGNHYYGGNPINNNHNGNNISISDRPMQRSGSPGKPALVPPPPPPASQSQPSPPGGYPPHNSHNGYAPRQDMPVSNVPPASHDYPAPRYTPHQPPYPGSVPPHPAGGYSHPPPQTSAPYNQNHGGHNGHSGTPEQQYPGSYPTPTSMPSYSAPPTQAPYGGPPPPMPEYSSQQPYISTGSNLQPKFDRHGAAAPPPTKRVCCWTTSILPTGAEWIPVPSTATTDPKRFNAPTLRCA